jgi:hypothetical protein
VIGWLLSHSIGLIKQKRSKIVLTNKSEAVQIRGMLAIIQITAVTIPYRCCCRGSRLPRCALAGNTAAAPVYRDALSREILPRLPFTEMRCLGKYCRGSRLPRCAVSGNTAAAPVYRDALSREILPRLPFTEMRCLGKYCRGMSNRHSRNHNCFYCSKTD